jgi:hypothetical protein
MSELTTQHTCAVHDVLMGSLQDQINSIEKGQKEVKDLIVLSHKEAQATSENSRMSIEVSAEKNAAAINRLSDRLDEEITKFYERDREYILALNDLKIETNNSLSALKAKHMALTVGGIAVTGTVTFLLNFFRIANQLIEIAPAAH